jgi:hypothetical protein
MCWHHSQQKDIKPNTPKGVRGLAFVISVMRKIAMSLEITDTKILVFLPPPAAEKVVGHLSGLGYAAIAASTFAEAFDALRSNEFSFAIATRPDISLLRHIRTIPVINMEIFFHADPAFKTIEAAPRHFDSKAFMARVEFLSRPVSSRLNGHEADGVKGLPPGDDRMTSRWWNKAATFWRLRPKRKAQFDVQG